MKNIKPIYKGIIIAFVTAVISGIAIFYSKITVTKIDPLIFATARNSYVGLLFLLLFLFTNKFKQILKLPKKDIFVLMVIGIIGGSIPFYLFFSGIKLIGPQSANLIHKSLFIWVAILGVFLLKEKVNIGFLIAGLLVFIGTYFFAPFTIMFGKGEQLIFIATLLWSVENIVAKKVLSKTSSEVVGLFRMTVGGIILFIVTLFSGKASLLIGMELAQWKTVFIGGSILFFYVLTWYKALSYAPVSLVTLILTFSLVVGNVLNRSIAHVVLSRNDWYSMIFILGAMGMMMIVIPLIKKTYSLIVRPHE